eukprot:SAG22_NODE_214_length_15003_cov_18.466519_18_plen_221_part_00
MAARMPATPPPWRCRCRHHRRYATPDGCFAAASLAITVARALLIAASCVLLLLRLQQPLSTPADIAARGDAAAAHATGSWWRSVAAAVMGRPPWHLVLGPVVISHCIAAAAPSAELWARCRHGHRVHRGRSRRSSSGGGRGSCCSCCCCCGGRPQAAAAPYHGDAGSTGLALDPSLELLRHRNLCEALYMGLAWQCLPPPSASPMPVHAPTECLTGTFSD